VVYWFWIWPILRSRPELHELYQQEESFFIALREKLKGIKQKLSSVLVIAASTVVSGYDFFAPIVSGVDNQFADRSGATMGLAPGAHLVDRTLSVPAKPDGAASCSGRGRRPPPWSLNYGPRPR